MIQEKDKQFQILIGQYENALWRVALTYEANFALQQELLQEIMLAIWQSLDNFKAESSAQTYIYRVAHNTALRHVEKQIRQLKSQTVDEYLSDQELTCPQSSPEKQVEQQQQLQVFSKAMRRLPLNQRQLVSLSLEGLTYPEIGEICGLNATNVGAILSRAKQSIKEYMR